jgi:1-deoxy-D-xylulose-5-phosphate reductoisomerase
MDGSILAQLSHPDMCLPIQYAMTYPERKCCPIRRLDLMQIKQLNFSEPDFKKFPCLELALSAGAAGGTEPAVLSASNEAAVHAFLSKKIRFTDIAKVVEKTLARHQRISNPTLNDLLESDSWAREKAESVILDCRKKM